MTDTRLSDEEIAGRLSGSGWQRDGDAIVREIELKDFAEVIDAVNRIAALAEESNHHPDILVHDWNRLRVTLSTHSAGGVTAADFALAAGCDELLSTRIDARQGD
jgi:4a-hydroxytetrahydrobiopterin dehydratase